MMATYTASVARRASARHAVRVVARTRRLASDIVYFLPIARAGGPPACRAPPAPSRSSHSRAPGTRTRPPCPRLRGARPHRPRDNLRDLRLVDCAAIALAVSARTRHFVPCLLVVATILAALAGCSPDTEGPALRPAAETATPEPDAPATAPAATVSWAAQAQRRIAAGEYAPQVDGAEPRITNRAQDLRGVFGEHGLAVTGRDGAGEVRLSLRAWGREGALEAATATPPEEGECSSGGGVDAFGDCLRRVQYRRRTARSPESSRSSRTDAREGQRSVGDFHVPCARLSRIQPNALGA
jgi:hypothetical protein